tara:strand:+ start:1435 stop:2457 length:1023 start_codon:yes stop_codon:yes gene_type:complete
MSDSCVAQLIDANLDRAREGLRVIEEWCRFTLQNRELVKNMKDWRQELGKLHLPKYKNARCITTDSGLGLTHPNQYKRKKNIDIIMANCNRAQEALRVLEEFARTSDPLLAKRSSEIRYKLYQVETNLFKLDKRSQRKNILMESNLYVVTSQQPKLIEKIESILQAGIKIIQYRAKEISDKKRLEQAKKIAELCRNFNALLIINDRVDIAIAVDADGVHLGQEDLNTTVTRDLIGHEKIIGRSTRSQKDIRTASKEDIDYIGLGPIFSTAAKPKIKPLGLHYIQEVSPSIELPWFAIGGIKKDNLKDTLEAGAKRFAIMTEIMNSQSPKEEVLKLMNLIK